ncbi:MAG: O-antigen ligase family protein [Nitrospirota bacterium]
MPRKSYAAFVAALVFSPLAFGSVEPWSFAVMNGLCFLGLLLSLLESRETVFYRVPGMLPLLLLLGFFLLQLAPLPAGLVRLVSPETWAVYAGTIGIIEPLSWVSLSLDKRATLMELLRLSGYAAFYVLTVQLLTRKELLRRTVTVVLVLSSALALTGILQYLFNAKKIFWFRELSFSNPAFFGPFVNRNHYAGFMAMVFPLALAFFLTLKPRVFYESLRDRIAGLLSRKETNLYLLIGLFMVLIAASIFLSISRGGIVSLSLSMVVFGLLFLGRRRNKSRGAAIIAVFATIVLAVGWFGWEPIIQRFEKITDAEGDIVDLRPTVWKDSLEIAKDFPVTGAGLGSFRSVYPRYQTARELRVIDHAHNDYMELLAEGGLIAMALMAWFIAAVVARSFRMYTGRKDSSAINLYIGSITGILALLLHGFTDFNFRIGSNGLYFFFLCGLAVSAAHTRLRDGLGSTYLEPRQQRPGAALPRLARGAAGAGLLVSVIINTGVLAAGFSYSLFKKERFDVTTPRQELLAVKGLAEKAALFDPLNAHYHALRAHFESLLLEHEQALESNRQALALQPSDGEQLQRLGTAYAAMAQPGTAERLLSKGTVYGRMDPQRYITFASWLLSQGRKEEGLKQLAQALSISPHRTRDFITFMVLNGLTDDDILGILPERVESHLAAAAYLAGIGSDEKADARYRQALQLVSREKTVKQAFFYEVFRYYTKKERYEEALSVMQQAITCFPDDSRLRSTAGVAYERLGMYHGAMEAYRKALLLDQGNREARQRLEFLTPIRGGG